MFAALSRLLLAFAAAIAFTFNDGDVGVVGETIEGLYVKIGSSGRRLRSTGKGAAALCWLLCNRKATEEARGVPRSSACVSASCSASAP